MVENLIWLAICIIVIAEDTKSPKIFQTIETFLKETKDKQLELTRENLELLAALAILLQHHKFKVTC